MNTNTKIDYIAFGDNVVVDPKIEDKTEGGIILTEKQAEENKAMFPEVVAIGEGVKNVKVGDKISTYFGAHPTLIPIGNKKYFSLKEYDILGKIIEKPVVVTI